MDSIEGSEKQMKLADLTFERLTSLSEKQLRKLDFLSHKLFNLYGLDEDDRDALRAKHALLRYEMERRELEHRTPSLDKTKARGDRLVRDLEGRLPGWTWIGRFVGIVPEEDGQPDRLQVGLRADRDPTRKMFLIELDEEFLARLRASLEGALRQPLSVDWHASPYGPNWPYIFIYDLVLRPREKLSVERLDEQEFAETVAQSEEERLLARLSNETLDRLLSKLREMQQEGVL